MMDATNPNQFIGKKKERKIYRKRKRERSEREKS